MFQKIIIAFIISTLFGCYPLPNRQREARIALEKEGIPSEIISKLNDEKDIGDKYANDLANNKSVGVRVMVASNPHIDSKLMKKFEYDESIFVREALAGNSSLSKEMMQRLVNQKSLAINGSLIMNDIVPSELLLSIYRNSSEGDKRMLLYYYANHAKVPNIPPEIRQVIMTYGDEDDKNHLMMRTRQWAESKKGRR
jgi:hypothetical protein